MNAIPKYEQNTLEVVKNSNNTTNTRNEVGEKVGTWLLNNFNKTPKVEEVKESEYPRLKKVYKKGINTSLKNFAKVGVLPPRNYVEITEDMKMKEKLEALEKQNKSLEASVKMLTKTLEKKEIETKQQEELEKKMAELNNQQVKSKKETESLKNENQRLKRTNQLIGKNADENLLSIKLRRRDLRQIRRNARELNTFINMENEFGQWPENTLRAAIAYTQKWKVGKATTMRMLMKNGRKRIKPEKIKEQMSFFLEKFNSENTGSFVDMQKAKIVEKVRKAKDAFLKNIELQNKF